MNHISLNSLQMLWKVTHYNNKLSLATTRDKKNVWYVYTASTSPALNKSWCFDCSSVNNTHINNLGLSRIPFVAQFASPAAPGSSCAAQFSSWSSLRFSAAGESGSSERNVMNLWLWWRSLTSVMVRRLGAWSQGWWWWWCAERRREGWKSACLILQPSMSAYSLTLKEERLTLST